MAQILTSIALYETLQRYGRSEEEAYRIVSEGMWKFLDPSGMQKLAKKSFVRYKTGAGDGWERSKSI